MFPALCTGGPAADLASASFDWLTHSIVEGRHMDTLAAAATQFSAFCMQPSPITDAQEQRLLDLEVVLELELEAERIKTAARSSIESPIPLQSTLHGPSRGQAALQTGVATGTMVPLQNSRVHPGPASSPWPPASSSHATDGHVHGIHLTLSPWGPGQASPRLHQTAPGHQQLLRGLVSKGVGVSQGTTGNVLPVLRAPR